MWAIRSSVNRAVKSVVRRHRSPLQSNGDPRNETSFAPEANPGPLTEFFCRIRELRGWFNVDDCAHFTLILGLQNAYGIHADLFEIGSYHGRSTALMAANIKHDERMVVCDAFRHDTADRYAAKPSVDEFVGNVMHLNPAFEQSRLVIYNCLSTNLDLPEVSRFRFVHIDGGHQKDVVSFDLNLAFKHLIAGGVVAVDDYDHPDWPDVTVSVNEFLATHPSVAVLADLNRRGAKGRKIYLTRLFQAAESS